MNTEKMKLVKKFGRRNVMVPIVACAFICSLAMATCWTPADGPACGTDQIADPTNGCTSITYSPENSQYCDSRDGECGHDASCTVINGILTKTTTIGQRELFDGKYICDMIGATQVQDRSGTCPQVTISGNKCGYCP
jgi:hypothetical protein